MKRTPLVLLCAALVCLAAVAIFLIRGKEQPISGNNAVVAMATTAGKSAANGKAAGVSQPSHPLFAPPAPATGQALDEKSPEFAAAYLRGGTPIGRVAVLSAQSFDALGQVKSGDHVEIPLLDGESVEGNVNYAQEEGGTRRVAGELTGQMPGSFVVSFDGFKVSGFILLPTAHRAYALITDNDGQRTLAQKPLQDVVCAPIPKSPFPQAIVAKDLPVQAIPLLDSRPDAICQIYLDFDGEVVTDPYWNNGKTINALPFSLSVATITNIFNRVKEDYWPFNINVTTDVNKYNNAPVGKRMRCIITKTNDAAPGSGGVAYLNSFRNAGQGGFTPNIPCWVFNSDEVGIAEAVSHEVGHTFNLGHDGRTSPVEEYYQGQGSGATSWCPIMGAGYYVNVTQWSKGEYANASNKQDDLFEISSRIGLAIGGGNNGYMPDDAGNTRSSAPLLAANPQDSSVSQDGIIEKTADVDYYTFTTNLAGNITLNGRGAVRSPNLDLVMALYDSAGVEVNLGTGGNLPNQLNATLTGTLPKSGVYYLKVTSSGALDPLTTGYSDYASIGAYTITGSIAGLTRQPLITSSGTATGQVGVLFNYSITATGNAESYSVIGNTDPAVGKYNKLPEGLTVDGATGLISGIPKVDGLFEFTVQAHNASGDGTKLVSLTVAPPALTMGQALDLESVVWTVDEKGPWLARTNISSDKVDAAQTSIIKDGEQTALGTTVTGPVVVSFDWKVSSELNGDFLAFQVDGVDAPGLAPISGEQDWIRQSVNVPEGSHQVRWVYRKNASLADGADQAYVDKVVITTGNNPVITSAGTTNGTVGNRFSYQIQATGYPNDFQVVGTLPAGLKIDAGSGLISGVPAIAGTSSVTLKATNRKSTTEELSGTLNLSFTISPSPITFEGALDTTGLTWTTSGAKSWFTENVVAHDETDAVQAGPISRNEQSILQTTLSTTASRTLTFFWKTESEANDRLLFYVNGNQMASLSGATDWLSPVFTVPAGAVLKWVYQKDAVTDSGRDTAWLDQVVITTDIRPVVTSTLTATAQAEKPFSYQIKGSNNPTFFNATDLPTGLTVDPSSGLITGSPMVSGRFTVGLTAGNQAGSSEVAKLILDVFPSLRDAVDLTDRAFTTLGSTGSSVWFAQLKQTYDKVDAAQSGVTLDKGTSTMSTQVTGPIDVKFFWKVSSEADHDELRFQIDGTTKTFISGEKDWSPRTVSIPAGPHTISWVYAKDDGFASGQDAGWVDMVSLNAGANVPVISSPLAANAYLGRSFSYKIVATNSPESYEAINLPKGFQFDATTGVISGAAMAAGQFDVLLAAKNPAGKGTAVLKLSLVSEPAGTDLPANATSLSGSVLSVVGSNDFATADPGEANHGGHPAHASVWFSWKAPSTGQVVVSTAGSAFDTTLSVYTQPREVTPSEGRAAQTFENDDTGKLSTSAVKVAVLAGDTLLIAVDSLDTRTGKVVLNINYTSKGTYTGLLLDQNGVADPGLATFSLSDQLAYSGSLLLDGQKYALKGTFVGEDSAGTSGKGAGVFQYALHLALAAGAQEITGAVTVAGVTYNVLAKLPMVGVDVPTSVQVPFTFLVETNNSVPGVPEGKGYGTLTVDKKGTVKAVGMLGDGTKFSSARPLALDKSSILFLTPYKKGGVLAGTLKIDQGGAFAPLSSALTWHKAADGNAALFPAGFLSSTTLRGYRYDSALKPILQVAPADPTQPILSTTADITFSASDSAVAPATIPLTISQNNLLTLPAGAKLKIDAKTGLFAGSFTPSSGGKAVAFAGAIVNGTETIIDADRHAHEVKISRGGGLYVTGQTTEKVEITPQTSQQ